MREKLTLILFKDHLTSRTLKVPIQWLPRLGLLWLIAMFLTLSAAIFLFRAYFQGSSGGGFALIRAESKVSDLEKQLAELKMSYDALQARVTGSSSTDSLPQESSALNFSAFPPVSLKTGLPPKESLPIRLEPLKAQWRGSNLQLTTAIEYIRDDGGNQQGHFLIFARGPQNLYAYPDGALSPAGSEVLARPEAGEYFSVSRYREIKASFGPAQTRDSIQSIELYIFDSKKNLIFVERARVEAPKPKAPPKPVEPPPPPPPPADEAMPSGATVPNGVNVPPVGTPPATSTETAPGATR